MGLIDSLTKPKAKPLTLTELGQAILNCTNSINEIYANLKATNERLDAIKVKEEKLNVPEDYQPLCKEISQQFPIFNNDLQLIHKLITYYENVKGKVTCYKCLEFLQPGQYYIVDGKPACLKHMNEKAPEPQIPIHPQNSPEQILAKIEAYAKLLDKPKKKKSKPTGAL